MKMFSVQLCFRFETALLRVSSGCGAVVKTVSASDSSEVICRVREGDGLIVLTRLCRKRAREEREHGVFLQVMHLFYICLEQRLKMGIGISHLFLTADFRC